MTRKFASLSMLLVLLAGCDNSSKTQPPAGQAAAPAAVTPAAPPPPATVAVLNELPTDVKSLPTEAGGICNFDAVAVEGERQRIGGWAIPAKDGKAPSKVFIRLSGPAGDRYVLAPTVKREDVAKVMNNPSVADSGFDVWLKKADVPQGARITVYQVTGNKVLVCEKGISA